MIKNQVINQEDSNQARERTATDGSVMMPSRLRPVKRGRGRPVLSRTGSVGRPQTLYHMVAAIESTGIGEETCSESSHEISDGDDEVFLQCNLTEIHNPTTWDDSVTTLKPEKKPWKMSI